MQESILSWSRPGGSCCIVTTFADPIFKDLTQSYIVMSPGNLTFNCEDFNKMSVERAFYNAKGYSPVHTLHA